MNSTTTATKREILINIILNELSDEQVETLLEHVRVFQLENAHKAKYDPAKDQILINDGLFDGPGDLAERAEEILYGDSDSE